jgi:hypothetical protein
MLVGYIGKGDLKKKVEVEMKEDKATLIRCSTAIA